MRQGNKLNLASNSANEHKRLSSVTMEIFFLNIRHVSLWSRSGLANEIHVILMEWRAWQCYTTKTLIKCAVSL